MNRYLSLDMSSKSNKIEDIMNWIENIIQNSTTPEHQKVCEKLVTNFTENLLLFKQDYFNYGRAEKVLRKLLLKKFQNI